MGKDGKSSDRNTLLKDMTGLGWIRMIVRHVRYLLNISANKWMKTARNCLSWKSTIRFLSNVNEWIEYVTNNSNKLVHLRTWRHKTVTWNRQRGVSQDDNGYKLKIIWKKIRPLSNDLFHTKFIKSYLYCQIDLFIRRRKQHVRIS